MCILSTTAYCKEQGSSVEMRDDIKIQINI